MPKPSPKPRTQDPPIYCLMSKSGDLLPWTCTYNYGWSRKEAERNGLKVVRVRMVPVERAKRRKK